MTATLISIGTLNPDGGSALARYASVVVPLIEAAGGEVLSRATFREGIVGDDFPGFVAVIAFPDAMSARRMMESAAYRLAVPDREEAFIDIRTFIGDPM